MALYFIGLITGLAAGFFIFDPDAFGKLDRIGDRIEQGVKRFISLHFK